MKRIRLPLLSMILIVGFFLSGRTYAQQSSCSWELYYQVIDPWCTGSCNGSISVTPSVNWPNFSFQWSHGATGDWVGGLCAGTYTVTVTDDKGCSDEFTYTLVDPAPLVASCVVLSDESYPGAADGSLEGSVSGGWGPYYFQWQTNPVQSTPIISGLTAGVYELIVIDEKQCVAKTECEITTKKKDCEPGRTQTQGGWGQCHQNGNNPGSYLFNNFASAFPNGLTLGCTRTLRLTTPQGVCEFLPSGTGPKVLPVGNMTNPGQSYRNVFAGQLAAAMLNVGFDLANPAFSASDVNLGEMIITSGLFEGWSVQALIDEANKKIGGCASSFSPSQLSNALASINENYTDGVVDNGFLTCPDLYNAPRTGTVENHMIKANVYPNPVSGKSDVLVQIAKPGKITVDLYNISGQRVKNIHSGENTTENNFVFEIDAKDYSSGVYFLRIVSPESIHSQKIIISK
jgi:hypothetical protein